MTQLTFYDPLVDAFYKGLRRRDFVEIERVIAQLRNGWSSQLQYPLWADYFAGILAEERDRDWATANLAYQRLLTSEAEPILRAHVLLSLAVAYDKQALWAESVSACEESARIWEGLGYPVKRAIVLRQIAISYRNGYFAGEFGPEALDLAAQYCRNALATLERHRSLPPEIVLYEPDLSLYSAIVGHELGQIEMAAGHWAQAITQFQQGLAFWAKRGDHYHAAFAGWNLGNAYQMLGADYWEQVEPLYLEALNHFRTFGDRYFEFNVYACLGSLHMRKGNLTVAADFYARSLTMIETVRAGISSEGARTGFFATVVNIYANAILTQIKTGELAKAFDYTERARARAFLDSLMIGSLAYARQLEPATLTCAEVQQLLPPDALLLEYYTTGLLTHGASTSEQQAVNSVLYPTPKTLLFAITHESIAVYDLGLSPNTLLMNDLAQPIEEHFLPTYLRRTLYTVLVRPAATLLQGKRRLYIIPHGPLHYVPFHALIAPDGDTLLRQDGPEIIYAPSATILLRPPPIKHHQPTATCLAVGYNGETGRRLRFAEEEARYIANMAGGRSLVGSTPKKALLYQQAPDYQALHFSCHGEFDPDSPLESMLHIGPGETLTGQEIIDHLHLNCDLVTLSACESGLSKVQRGDELYGLVRAFMYAGAPSILATLWRVDECSTLLFAQHFYQCLQQKMAYAAALKASQLYLKHLTRQEALVILRRHLGNEDAHRLSTLERHQKSVLAIDAPLFALSSTDKGLSGSQEDEHVFSDPKFWAPFVLISVQR